MQHCILACDKNGTVCQSAERFTLIFCFYFINYSYWMYWLVDYFKDQ